MHVKGDAFSVAFDAENESLVVEQYADGGISRRVTIALSGWAAEELAERLGDILKRRRENAARLERCLIASAAAR